MFEGLLGKIISRKRIERLAVKLAMDATHDERVAFFRDVFNRRMTRRGRDHLAADLKKIAFSLEIQNPDQAAIEAATAMERFRP